ncbi:HigA family addiction module antitoxin [Apilactobacillus bombintestini]
MTIKHEIYKVIISYVDKGEINMNQAVNLGNILKEEFMNPYHLSASQLARHILVPTSRIQDILHNRRKITLDTSIRLGKFFGASNTYFLNM